MNQLGAIVAFLVVTLGAALVLLWLFPGKRNEDLPND